MVTSSEHSCMSKTHSRLSEHDSRPPVSSQSADTDKVESPSRNRESNFRSLGGPSSGHVCNCGKLPPSSVHVSDSGATSTGGGCSVSGLAGEVDVHVSSFSPAQQVIQKLRSTQEAEVILIAEVILVAETVMVSTPTLSVWTIPCSFHTARIFCHNRVRDTSRTVSRTICIHGGSRATLQSSRLFRRGF